MDNGILILRILLAVILFAHAFQKTTGWFQGKGLSVMSGVFESLGLYPGRIMVLTAACSEMIAGFLILTGFLTPLAACIGAGVMLTAGWTLQFQSRSFWNSSGGGEYPYVVAALFGVIAVTGPGAYAGDKLILTALPQADPLLSPSPLQSLVVLIIAFLAAFMFRARVQRNAEINRNRESDVL